MGSIESAATTHSAPLTESALEERQALAEGARLHWFHWAILVLSGVLTLGAWHVTKLQLQEKSRLRFDRESSQVFELVVDRMRRYEDALWSGVAAIQSSGGAVAYAQWRAFAEMLHIETKLPGINGIGVIQRYDASELAPFIAEQRQLRPDFRVFPEHDQSEYLPIVYIEPEAPNQKAVGLDVAHERNRYQAAKRARNSGLAQITGPIVLVQDEAQTPGFLFYAPYYMGGTYETVTDRRRNFVGMVYAPFIVSELLAGTLEKSRRLVGVRLSDRDEILYDELQDAESDFDLEPMFKSKYHFDQYGRNWTFDIWSSHSFRQAARSSQPGFILLAGLILDSLLLTLFLLLSRSNRRTLSFADRMTMELQRKAAALENSNEELESFAYVTSHDLKTPLRGISDLTSYLEEDLEDYMGSPDANEDVRRNLGRLERQTRRMEALIRGILDYSKVGVTAEVAEHLDVAEYLRSLPESLGVRESQVELVGDFPVFETYRVRFEQVVNNLVGNAFKYHQNVENAQVKIACTRGSDYYEFSISDDGPGIDPKFHSRIFEVFQTLQSNDEIESTGVGLSIVKKSVEALGGKVSIVSEPGRGTMFMFEWPKSVVG